MRIREEITKKIAQTNADKLLELTNICHELMAGSASYDSEYAVVQVDALKKLRIFLGYKNATQERLQ